MEEWSFDVLLLASKKVVLQVSVQKRIYYSNSLFSRHEILHWIEQITCNKSKKGAKAPIPV